MAKECALCGKQKSIGNNRKLLRGHYNITSKREFKPNLQKKLIDGKKQMICVKCLRNKSKQSATIN